MKIAIELPQTEQKLGHLEVGIEIWRAQLTGREFPIRTLLVAYTARHKYLCIVHAHWKIPAKCLFLRVMGKH